MEPQEEMQEFVYPNTHSDEQIIIINPGHESDEVIFQNGSPITLGEFIKQYGMEDTHIDKP